jgi:hypothetical protein
MDGPWQQHHHHYLIKIEDTPQASQTNSKNQSVSSVQTPA